MALYKVANSFPTCDRYACLPTARTVSAPMHSTSSDKKGSISSNALRDEEAKTNCFAMVILAFASADVEVLVLVLVLVLVVVVDMLMRVLEAPPLASGTKHCSLEIKP